MLSFVNYFVCPGGTSVSPYSGRTPGPLRILDGDIDKILIIHDWSFHFVSTIVLVFIAFTCLKFEHHCV